MREILFRGRRLDNAEWVDGYLYEHEPELVGIVSENDVPEPSKWFIARTGFADWNMPRPVEFVEVDPATVGQYTGLADKNEKKIFEGDIIEWFAQGESEHPDFGYIEYDEQSFAWRVCWQKYDPDWLEGMQSQHITVIGNIFDNKDLLS